LPTGGAQGPPDWASTDQELEPLITVSARARTSHAADAARRLREVAVDLEERIICYRNPSAKTVTHARPVVRSIENDAPTCRPGRFFQESRTAGTRVPHEGHLSRRGGALERAAALSRRG
jgi:hypothetical protein